MRDVILLNAGLRIPKGGKKEEGGQQQAVYLMLMLQYMLLLASAKSNLSQWENTAKDRKYPAQTEAKHLQFTSPAGFRPFLWT